MYQAVYNYKELTQYEVHNNFSDVLIKTGDKVINEHNYGITSKINIIKFLQSKNLLPMVQHLNDTNLLSCCLQCTNTTKILIKLSNSIR